MKKKIGSEFVEINYILIGVGLIVCFGGIYLKNFCTGLLGLIWGLIGSFIVAMMTVGLWKMFERDTILTVLVCAAIIGLLSAALYRVSMAINGFLSSFSIVLLFLPSIIRNSSIWVVLGVAVIIGLIVAVISYKFSEYSIIIMTAFSGAYIASIGAIGVYKHYSISEQISNVILFNFERMMPVLIGTFILGLIGIGVQSQRFRHRENVEVGNSDNYQETIQPIAIQDEGIDSEMAEDIMKRNDEYKISLDEKVLFCNNCGATLTNQDLFCSVCGYKIKH